MKIAVLLPERQASVTSNVKYLHAGDKHVCWLHKGEFTLVVAYAAAQIEIETG